MLKRQLYGVKGKPGALTASAEAKNAAGGLSPDHKDAAQGTTTVGISASYGSQSSKSENTIKMVNQRPAEVEQQYTLILR